jgi:hypothetical protein
MDKASGRHMELEADQEARPDVEKFGTSYQQEIVEHE